VAAFRRSGWGVIASSRTATFLPDSVEPLSWSIDGTKLGKFSVPIDAVIWAQGSNCADNIRQFDVRRHLGLYEANVLFILESLKQLLDADALASSARMCVISSIWQELARQDKLSYCVTKSALSGLVRSIAVDLGRDGHLINAILPGPIDTPMTRSNLSDQQIGDLTQATPIGRLAGLTELCEMAEFLCSTRNSGITGQFIRVDGGYSDARIL
jgi:NAD(P)-dependent dehydrogenase (short-subunit alcohol dehydrogenase family)